MGITQVDIKINQTNQMNGGKPKIASKSGAAVNSFDQVLAMVNLLGQRPGDKVQPDLIGNCNEKQDFTGIVSLDEEKSLMLNEEKIEQLQSMLAMFLNRYQEIQQTQGTVNDLTDNPRGELSSLLTQGLELVEGVKKHASVNSSELLHKVTELIGEIQENTQETPVDAEEKIQIILNELKKVQKTSSVPELIGPQSNEQMEHNSQQMTQGISLDKNQVLHLAKVTTEVQRNSGLPLSPRAADFTDTNGQPIFMNHQPQVSSNELRDVNQTSKLDITEFAPEVSEWISRFVKISNGKSGSTEAKFSLFPEHLGHIEIKITTQQGQVSARILTDTTIAKDALEGQLQHLKQALQQTGLYVQKLDVVQQTTVSNDLGQAGLGFSQDSSQSSREQRTYTNPPNNKKEHKELSEQNEHDREITPITYGGGSLKTSSRIDFTA